MAEKNKDLEVIKKRYGERMSHLCRELFPTLLETEGLLSDLILSKFNEDKSLYDVIVKDNKQEDFKNYIYSFIDVEKGNTPVVNKTPKELLNEAGYDFHQCKTEAEIQSYKKYYASGEALCTFNGNRLNTNQVFFAVKKNVEQIKRKDFKNPKRQDEYGTSVISIQFTHGQKNTLSIKNRYNHKVNNPDATFGNNLDNIIEGLNAAFEREYGFVFDANKTNFELPNYVLANDGKLCRYNQEINNIYYCPDNKIIDNGEVKTLDSTKQILMDYFVVNLSGENKGIELYDESIGDSFVDGVKQSQKISIEKTDKKDGERKVTITLKDGNVTIGLDKDNRITSLDNPMLTHAGDNFLYYNETLKTLSLPQLTHAGNSFLYCNEALKTLSLENLTHAGDDFLYRNNALETLSLPQLTHAGDKFLYHKKALETLSLENLTHAGHDFLYYNETLKTLPLPQLTHAGNNFLYCNEALKTLSLENLTHAGDNFLFHNKALKTLSLPQLTQAENNFLFNNKALETLSLENLTHAGHGFLFYNEALESLALENLTHAGDSFLLHNKALESLLTPLLEEKGEKFLSINKRFKNLTVEQIRALAANKSITETANTQNVPYIQNMQSERNPFKRVLGIFSGLKKTDQSKDK